MYGKYWEETKAWKICENEGCGKLLPTYDDMQKHMFYHCKNNDGDPFINKSNEGKIDRRTMRGFGLPSEDMFMFKGKVMYGKIRKWICLVCHFERNKYGWHQVFGHVASEHGYQSRIKNNRWNIPEDEQYKETKEATRPENIDMYMAQEISYGNIEFATIDGEFIFKCLKCSTFQDMRPLPIRRH